MEPQKRLRFRDLHGKTLALKKRMVIISRDSEASPFTSVTLKEKTRRFAFALLIPLRVGVLNRLVLSHLRGWCYSV